MTLGAVQPIMRRLWAPAANEAWNNVSSKARKKKRTPTSFEDMGRRLDKAAGHLDKEAERLIAYLNDEVVPSVRKHSSRGLRTASKKLADFAAYLDSRR